MPGAVLAGEPARATLPLRLTRFVGRSAELAELRRLLEEFRLVTLTGPGGAGKTRLALETAAAVAPQFEGRAFLVDLAALSRPELLLDAVARAFPMEPAPSRPLLDALADFLCDRPALIILDNCEHLLDASAGLAASLLAACPTLTVLTTSREPLGVTGECTFRVPLLSVPDPDHPGSPEQMLQFEAVQLFLDRARLADPAFALTELNVPSVAQVCARLDGIPLALELAAAALRIAALADVAARLDQRFRLLSSSGRSNAPRHQTLAALLDWSYALLEPEEQAVFRKLGILPADWTLDAAETVCGDDLAPDERAPAVLALVNKSLVQFDQGGARYRLLETIRMYSLARLTAAGEREKAAARLFEWCRRFLAEGASHLDRPGQHQWFARLEREQPNFRVALEWAVAAGRGQEAADLALALRPFWSARAYHREARDWLQRILALESLPAQRRAPLLQALGFVSHTLNDFDASDRCYSEELALWRAMGDPNGIAGALSDLAWLRFQKMDLAGAEPLAEEALTLARQGGDHATIANALQVLAATRIEAGHYDGVEELVEECLAIWRRLGVRRGEAAALAALARIQLQAGRPREAAAFMLEALGLLGPLGDQTALIDYLVLMVSFEFDIYPALRPPEEPARYSPFAYLGHGRLRHGPARAASLLGVMAAWQDRIIGANAIQWDAMMVPICEKLKAEMGEAAFEREFAAARTMNVDDIISFAEQYARSVLAGPGTEAPQPAAPAPRRKGGHAAGGYAALTPREVEVLRLVAEGLSNREAAERLVVTPRTINAHLTSIYAKTGVTSRVAAVRFAFERGLVKHAQDLS